MSAAKPGFAVDEVVPHAGTMSLLDRILEYDDDSLTAEVTIRPDSLFLGSGRAVPSWIGIEYMAQTIAAWAGVQARLNGEPVRMGFLLGTRRYTPSQPAFLLGEQLTVRATRIYHEGELGVFDCRINSQRTVVQATLNVYQPAHEQKH